jgi:hypothetical protein
MAQLNWVRQQQSGGQVMTDEMGRPLLNEDGTSRMTTVDPNSINEWNNGKTGNEGVSYAYDPATDSFRMTQGDATSGFHRWTANQQGTQDLGFEDYDRNSKYKEGLGTMAAITAAVAGGALLSAYAGSAGLTTQGTTALGVAPEAAYGTWGASGAAEVAAGAGATALETGAAGAAGAGAGGAGLSMESILANNFASNPMGMPDVTELGQTAMYGAPTSIPGATAAMTTGAATGPLLESGLSNSFGAPVTAGATAALTGSQMTGPQRPGGQQGNSVLDNILNGNAGGADLARLIAGLIGSNQQRNYGEALLQRAADATPNRTFYEGQLRSSYESPQSYLEGPEYQAAQAITHNKLQRSDAAGGRLANDYGRQVGLQQHALSNLDQYRRTLSGITGQNQATYSGQNNLFQQGAQADNSYLNGVLSALLSRGGGTQSQTNNTGTPNTGSGWNLGQLPSWLQGGTAPQINLDAIA